MSTPANINSLFNTAQQEQTLSAAGAGVALVIPDMGAQIAQGIGISVDDVQASEVTLVTVLIDDSGSIAGPNADAVRSGHNTMLEALGDSKQKDGVLAHCRYLNGQILYPYTQLANAIKMDKSNYNPNKGTPLYDATALILATVLAKSQEFTDAGVPCRTVTAIITDGADIHSRTHTRPEAIAPLVKDMLKTEMHIICAMGVDDGSTNFTDIFTRMGILPNWILTPKNTPSEIRKAFAVVSQSAVRASQIAGAQFSQIAAGGFGNP